MDGESDEYVKLFRLGESLHKSGDEPSTDQEVKAERLYRRHIAQSIDEESE